MSDVKERGILFKPEMIKAILDGRKTMTRRVDKKFNIKVNEFGKIDFNGRTRAGSNCELESLNDEFLGIVDKCPLGYKGDLLYVKEKFCYTTVEDESETGYLYALEYDDTSFTKWKSPLFMPKAAARIWLEITDVKVERLQDLSRGDAMSEGCPYPNMAKETSPVVWFTDLWKSINGEESWNSNPFVWAITFKIANQ